MNQFHKFHHLELRNLILTYFKNILKNKENAKVACRKENGNQILLKMSLAEPKDSKDENFEDLKLFKKETEFGITKWSREELFSKPKRIREKETDTWLLSCMPKVAMQNRSCFEEREWA